MGKPTNLPANKGCTPNPSTCVIWQGKNIDCLEICKGTSIDDVIHQIGCLMCTIKDQLDVDTYDLTCFNLDKCDIPHTFREYQQFLIGLICQLRDAYLNGDAGAEATVAGIPSVNVASCFQAELGNSALITDYIVALGQKVCEQETIIQNQQQAIVQMLARLDALEA